MKIKLNKTFVQFQNLVQVNLRLADVWAKSQQFIYKVKRLAYIQTCAFTGYFKGWEKTRIDPRCAAKNIYSYHNFFEIRSLALKIAALCGWLRWLIFLGRESKIITKKWRSCACQSCNAGAKVYKIFNEKTNDQVGRVAPSWPYLSKVLKLETF